MREPGMVSEPRQSTPSFVSQASITEILEDTDKAIHTFASMRAPRRFVPPEVIDIAIDEITQDIRIGLWKASQKEPLASPKAYAKRIAYTASIDMIRWHKRNLPLPADVNDDLDYTEIMHGPGYPSPADEYELQETVAIYAEIIVQEVLSLPPRQSYAWQCNLKKLAEDIQPLMDAFLNHGVDLEKVHHTEDKDERQRLSASATASKRRLRASIEQRISAIDKYLYTE